VLPGRESPAIARTRAAPTAITAASRPTAIWRLAVTRTGETGTGETGTGETGTGETRPGQVRENNSGKLAAFWWST